MLSFTTDAAMASGHPRPTSDSSTALPWHHLSYITLENSQVSTNPYKSLSVAI